MDTPTRTVRDFLRNLGHDAAAMRDGGVMLDGAEYVTPLEQSDLMAAIADAEAIIARDGYRILPPIVRASGPVVFEITGSMGGR